jgi:anti-sigma regulatory factor (Ser/Thr protein kinase)
MADDLVIRVRDEFDHVVLRLSGLLTLRSVSRLREVTVKWLQGTGCVLIDVSRVRVSKAAMVTVFPTALGLAGGWPAARLVLFGANAALRAMLDAERVPQTVPVAEDLPAACALLHQWPPQVRRHRDLLMHISAPAAARQFVRESCTIWSVPQAVGERAELVVNELVTNVVQHARTCSQVTLTCTESALRVSVRDYRCGSIPRPRPVDAAALCGRGLHLVARLAHTWGAQQHVDGKTIWASFMYQRQA